MKIHFDKIFGVICILLGALIALFALSDLIIRFLIAIGGLFLINYGLRLRGMPPLHIAAIRLWSTRYF